MTELLRAYDEIYKVKREYCVICLRSSEERRMVNIKTLERFIQSINLPFNYIDAFQKICYVCERAAAAAYRFRLAVNLSGAVHGLYLMMGRSKRSCEDIERQIRGSKAQAGVVRNVPEWEARLGAVRARSALLQTEVLVVNSLLMPGENVARGASAAPRGACADVYLVPDAAPAPPAPHPAPDEDEEIGEPANYLFEEPEIYMESVVLVDDEVDPIEIKREDPAFDEITIEETGVEIGTRRKEPTGIPSKMTILNSLLTNRNSTPSLVPIENLIDSQSTTNLALIPDEGIMQTHPTEPTNFLLHPIVERDGLISVPSLAAQIVNGQLITVDNSNIVIQTPKLALQNGTNFNLLTDPNQVTNLLKSMSNTDMSQVTVVSDHISMDALENNVMQSLSRVTVMQSSAVAGVGSLDNSKGKGLNLKVASEAKNRRGTSAVQSAKDSEVVIRNNVLDIEFPESPEQGMDMFVPGDNMESIIIYDEEETTVTDKRTQRKKEMVIVVGKKRQSETESKRSKRDEQASEREGPGKQWETDWEDKIPTEVISTMDAVDPNAAKVLAPPPPPPAPAPVISNVHSIRENVHTSLENDTPRESVISIENVHSEVFSAPKTLNVGVYNSCGRSAHSGGTVQVVYSLPKQLSSTNVRGESVTQSIRSLVESVHSAKGGSVQSPKATRLRPRAIIGVQKGAGGKVVADQSVCDIIDLS